MTNVFNNIENLIADSLGENLFTTSTGLIESFAPIFAICFGTYLLMILVSYWSNGGINEIFVDLLKRTVTWSIIIFCAFNASQYTKLAKFIYNFDQDLAQAAAVKIKNKSASNSYNGNTINQQIENLNAKLKPLENAIQDFKWSELGKIIKYEIVISTARIIVYVLLAGCFALYLVSKVCLALVLMVGPLFLGLMLFPQTRQWSINWVSQVANYVMSAFMLGLSGLFQIYIIDDLINSFDPGNDIVGTFLFVLAAIVTAIIINTMIKNIPQIASALTGGAVVSSNSGLSLKTVGAAAGAVALAASSGGVGVAMWLGKKGIDLSRKIGDFFKRSNKIGG